MRCLRCSAFVVSAVVLFGVLLHCPAVQPWCVLCEQTNASSVGGLVIVDWPASDGGVELTAVAITLDLLPSSMNSSSNGTNGSTTASPLDTSSLCVGDGYGFLADLTPVVSRSQPVAVAIAGLTGGCR